MTSSDTHYHPSCLHRYKRGTQIKRTAELALEGAAETKQRKAKKKVAKKRAA